MNLTLSVEKGVVERAREVARRQGSSLNQMIRDYLRMLAGKHGDRSSVDELFTLMDASNGSLQGRRIVRDELHAR